MSKRVLMACSRSVESAELSRMFPPVSLDFDSTCDRKEVEQVGGVDLCKAVATHTIPGDAFDNILPANCLAEPGLLLPRPKDAFERARQMQYIHDHLSESADEIQRNLAEKSINRPAPASGVAASSAAAEE